MNAAIEATKPAVANMPRPNPTLSQRIWNLAAAVAAFVSDGCRTVTKDQCQERLAIRDPCPERHNNNACGCEPSLKAQARALARPLGKWPVLAEENRGDLSPPR